MRRFPALTSSLIICFVALLTLSACGGGKSNSSGSVVTQIAMSASPNTVIDQGGIASISAIPENSAGTQVTQATAVLSVDPGQNRISVSTGGRLCAGSWDSLTTPVVCTPTTDTGVANVIATAGSVTAKLAITVLPHIDNVSIAEVDTPTPDAAGLDCISQSASTSAYVPNTRMYTVNALSNGQPVSLENVAASAVTWSIATPAIGSVAAQTKDNNGTTVTDSRFGIVTANAPGKTQVTATLGTHQAAPADFITCPVRQITIKDSASPATPFPLSSATTMTLAATIIDSKGVPMYQSATDTATNKSVSFPLAWNNSQPIAAGVSSAGVVTANSSPGTTTVVASCTPPSCNLALGTVYSNALQIPVSGTAPATTVYVASAAQAGSGSSAPGKTLLPFSTTDNSFGTAISLGDVPNSIVISRSGSVLFVGTASGLITIPTTTNTPTTPLTTAPGRIVKVSPNGNTVLVSDGSHVFVVDVASNKMIQTLNITGAQGADFTVDNSKAYIVGTKTDNTTSVGQLTVYNASIFPLPQTILAAPPDVSTTGATDVTFLASGPFAYIADATATNGSLSTYASCNDVNTFGTFGTNAAPSSALVGALPDGLHLLTVSSPTPDVNLVTATIDAPAFSNPTAGCAPAVSNTSTGITFSGVTTFSPKQLLITSDGTRAFVLSDQHTLLGASIDASAAIPLAETSITLANNATQTTGGITSDGKQVYFGGSDNQIHHIDLTASQPSDSPIALPSTAPAGFTTDFVVVRPK